MNYQFKILNLLLDKYEKSAHFKGEAAVNRRILLSCDEKTLGIDFSDYNACDDFRHAVISLAEMSFIDFDWKRKDYLINRVWLLTDKISEIYGFTGRPDKRNIINSTLAEIQKSIDSVTDGWIQSYLKSAYEGICEKHSLSGVWGGEPLFVSNFLKALVEIDKLAGKEASMRAFSVALFSDSKYFEKNIKSVLLPVIRRCEPTVSEAEEISDRDALAQVGIIMMPEIFEFCGGVSIGFTGGTTDFSPIKKGACISSDCVGDILEIRVLNAKRIVFIENKTNYSEYVLNEFSGDEIVVFHGGFYSPAKARFFSEIYKASTNIPHYFWGDIDLGGFKMFCRLKKNIIPDLQPLNMDKTAFVRLCEHGVFKGEQYIQKVKALLDDKDYEQFYEIINLIAEKKIIVEQEAFLGAE